MQSPVELGAVIVCRELGEVFEVTNITPEYIYYQGAKSHGFVRASILHEEFMAAKESAEMIKARKLIKEQGLSAYAAAKKVGITRSAIYMAPWYKEWKGAQK